MVYTESIGMAKSARTTKSLTSTELKDMESSCMSIQWVSSKMHWILWEMVINLLLVTYNFFAVFYSICADRKIGVNVHSTLEDSESLDFEVNVDESDLGC